MCQKCVVVESLSKDVVAHIGYGNPKKDEYEKILDDDIVIQTPETRKRLSQEQYLELWTSLKNKDGFGIIESDVPQENNSACAVCGEYLITVPGIDAQCYVPNCTNTKHNKINYIKDNGQEIKKEMEQYFGPDGAGEGKSNNPIELAVRAGIHCPNNHWVCSDCLTYNREKIPQE